DQIVSVKTGEGKKEYGRLREGDRVEDGTLLALVDDRLARNGLAIQIARLAAAEADLEAAVATSKEAQARLDRADRLLVKGEHIFSAEEYNAMVLTRDRYKAEEKS